MYDNLFRKGLRNIDKGFSDGRLPQFFLTYAVIESRVTQIWLSLRPPIFNSQMTQIFDLCPNLMCGDIRLGEEREMSTENYMWKWMLESHFFTSKHGHSLWTPGRSLWPRISASG